MKTKLVHAYSGNSLAPPHIRSHPSKYHPNQNGIFLDMRRNSHRPSIISEVDLLQKDKANQDNKDSGLSGYIKDLSARTFKKKTLYKKFPILSWIQTYTLSTLIADLITGFTIGLTVLPQSMAYATIADLPPQVGLYSGLVGPFIYIFFGTSKFVTIGPTAGMAMITLSYIEGKPHELAILLCFITGITTLLMGLLQFGFVLNFLSVPVMSGFTFAMAIAICSTQLPHLLGVHDTADGFIHMLELTYEHSSEYKWVDLAIGGVCIIVLIVLQHTQSIAKLVHPKIIPHNVDNFLWFVATGRNIIVIAVCTIIFGYVGEPLDVEIIGHIEPGLPKFTSPPFRIHGNNSETGETEEFSILYFLSEQKSSLFLVPLIALAEHITIAKDLENGRERVDTSQEMICIGLSNLIGSFLGSMPVTGSFVRPNHVNQSTREQSPLGGAVTGILVILTLLFLTPYFYHIPHATIAAVIVAGVIGELDIRIVMAMWRSKKLDLIPWTVTFVVGLAVSLEYGILLGLGISLVFILYYAALPQIRVNMGQTSSGTEFVMVELDRSLTFPSIDYSQHALMKSGTQWALDKYPVVIDCQHIQFADYSAAHGIGSLFIKFNTKSQNLVLWKMKPSVLRIVSGVMDCSGVNYKHCSTEKELEDWLDLKDVIVEIEEGDSISSSPKDENVTFVDIIEDP